MLDVHDRDAIRDTVRKLPKAELHLHLEGSISVATMLELAEKHGKRLPAWITAQTIFRFDDLDDFLRVASLSFEVMLDRDDFARVTWEMLRDSAQQGARHVEFFFSPSSHPTLHYADMIAGIGEGMQRARCDFAVSSFVIPSHNRMLGQAAGLRFIDDVLRHRSPDVVGIGLEFAERAFPPDAHRDLYALAKAEGLMLTAHAGEDGPAAYVRTCVEELRCDRIDHGYSVVEDPGLMRACRDAGIPFTCCPTTTRHTTRWKDPADKEHAIHQMIANGLAVTINTDDPGFFQSDLTNEYMAMGASLPRMVEWARTSIDSSWLPPKQKLLILDELNQAVEQLRGPSARVPN